MLPVTEQMGGFFAVLIGIVVAALLGTLAGLVIRRWAGRRAKPQEKPLRDEKLQDETWPAQAPVPLAAPAPAAAVTQVAAIAQVAAMDGEVLLAAVQEAEAEGSANRLAGLYLSLGQWRSQEGDARGAADFFRKCIRSATSAGLKEPHAQARVALGDIAQASSDPSTACEHWQIARLLFHELRQKRAYEAVDERMQRNKCPTDWVLTDF
jgi:tetratricopeptide (TPR) repeat protein